jgi:hypothetical protein
VKQWLETLAGALAWFASLCLSFAWSPWACRLRSQPVLFLIPLAALAITCFAGWTSWARWRQVGREFPDEAAGEIAATRAMASGGVLLNGLFVLVIVAQLIVPAILGACE